MIQRDSSGKEYVEVETAEGESLRLTRVPASQAGYNTDSLRFQIRQADGRLRPGPEVPLASMPPVIAGAWTLSVDVSGAELLPSHRFDEPTARTPNHQHAVPDIDHDLYEKLCEVARVGSTVDYTTVFGDPNEARQSGRPLGLLSMYDHIHGRPLITVVAVRRDSQMPGAGFFNWARDHDAGQFGTCDIRVLNPGEDELEFVVRQRKAVDALWKR